MLPTHPSLSPPVLQPTPNIATPTILWDSQQLFGKLREISILHHGETYRLRITRQERLILTK